MTNTNNIVNIFGTMYSANNHQLQTNYNILLYQKEQLLKKLLKFLNSDDNEIILTPTDIDILCLNSNDFNYYIEYYNYNELELLRILKQIAIDKTTLTNEDYSIVYSFIKNKSLIENIYLLSSPNKLVLDKKTINIILSIISRKTLTIGHTIKLYESLSRKEPTIQSAYKLEYKPHN